MKIIVLGLRGLPGIAGGIEAHCEHLYPLIAGAGVEVEVIVRNRAHDSKLAHWRGIRIRRIWAPRRKGLEAFLHTFIGVLYAAARRPDVLHLHAVGPAIFTPLARFLGLNVVVTHHGSDYARAKWGRFGKRVLKAGERMAMRYANEVISVSRAKAEELRSEYGRDVAVIPNGVPRFGTSEHHRVLDDLGVEPRRYVLHVGRAVPEKRQDDLVRAFAAASLPGWKLVIVGDMSGDDAHCRSVRALAEQNPDVVLAGFQTGKALEALFCNAGCFALPSTVEGFSIALLEALSAGCITIASDIPANHEIELPPISYFEVGNIGEMAEALSRVQTSVPREVWSDLRLRVHQQYDWLQIAKQTVRVYRDNSRTGTSPPTGQDRQGISVAIRPK